MHTYEISQYQRKPLNASFKQMKSTAAAASNFNYDSYFQTNYKKSVSFDDQDLEDKLKETAKEAKVLWIENARKTDQINTLTSQVKKLNGHQCTSNNGLNLLSKENKELKQLVEGNKKQLEELENERNKMLKRNNKLSKDSDDLRTQLQLIAKQKEIMEQQLLLHQQPMNNRQGTPIDNELSNHAHQQHQYEKEINHLRNQIGQLNDLNKQLNSDNEKLEGYAYDNRQLSDEINKLKTNSQSQHRSLLEELNNQITKLNSHIDVLEKEKNRIEKEQRVNKQTNEEMVKELNSKNTLLDKENEELNKRLFEMKKNNQTLARDKESLIKKINQFDIRLKDNKTTLRHDNEILIECLKNENEELKFQNQRMRRLIEVLLNFVNDIAGLFSHNELNLEHIKDNPGDAQAFLSQLEQEIESLMNSNKNKSKRIDSKWNQIEEKLVYRPSRKNELINSLSEKEEEGDQYKIGKCTACDLGCNATLKGCSPLFVAKKNICKNHPLIKATSYNR